MTKSYSVDLCGYPVADIDKAIRETYANDANAAESVASMSISCAMFLYMLPELRATNYMLRGVRLVLANTTDKVTSLLLNDASKNNIGLPKFQVLGPMHVLKQPIEAGLISIRDKQNDLTLRLITAQFGQKLAGLTFDVTKGEADPLHMDHRLMAKTRMRLRWYLSRSAKMA